MAYKYCFEALDRTLKDVMSKHSNCDAVFGGKVVVFGGDFRQILPVVPRGSRSDIVHSSINASYIWDFCEIGEGRISEPNDGYADIEIPPEILITTFENPIDAIVDSTYPEFLDNFQDYNYLKRRVILASTIEIVDQIDDHVLQMMQGEVKDFYSSNSVDRYEIHDPKTVDLLNPEFLSSLRTSGLPNHHIKLKVGAPIMLMRNIDQAEGLCNGTRLIVTKMGNHVIQEKMMGEKGHGNVIYIPRMDMSPSQSLWPFKLNRRQFPIIVSYAMTINKSQGQSLDFVGLYLPRDVFSHGQIYVVISRVTSKNNIKILIHDENNNPKRTNVVYREVFHNI